MLGASDFGVAVVEISIYPSASMHVLGVVAPSENKATHDSKVRLDDVEPRGVGRSPDGLDAEPLEQCKKARMVVSPAQVVQDDEEALVRVALPKL
jgi:hypothetical protein